MFLKFFSEINKSFIVKFKFLLIANGQFLKFKTILGILLLNLIRIKLTAAFITITLPH